MHRHKLGYLLGGALALAAFPLMAVAQTQPSTPPPGGTTPPAATKPAPATPPGSPDKAAPGSPDKGAQAKTNPLVGLAVFSSDGNKLGTVHSVSAEPDGKVKAIRIKTGGFLGIGGKLVAIPEGKFTKAGDNIQLGMTADEVSKLPEVKEQS